MEKSVKKGGEFIKMVNNEVPVRCGKANSCSWKKVCIFKEGDINGKPITTGWRVFTCWYDGEEVRLMPINFGELMKEAIAEGGE